MTADQSRAIAARIARQWIIRAEKDAPSYKDYVARKKRDGEDPMEEDEWEARVLGDESGDDESDDGAGEQERVPHDEPLPPSIDDALDGDEGPVSDLVEAVKKKKWPTRAKVREVYELVKEKVRSFGKKDAPSGTPAEEKGAEDLMTWLTQWLDIEGTSMSKKPDVSLKAPSSGGRNKEPRLSPAQSKSLKEYAETHSGEGEKEYATKKKEYAERKKTYEEGLKKILPVLEKAGLTSKDVTQMQTYTKKMRGLYEAEKRDHEKNPEGPSPKEPNYQQYWENSSPKLPKLPKEHFKAVLDLGDPPKAPPKPDKEEENTPEEIKRDFIKTLDDPKVKKRFEDMSPEDFMAALKSMSKKGSLRAATIRLAYVRPDLRGRLLTALRES